MLNGEAMDRVGRTVSWTPQAGKYALALADPEGNILDSVILRSEVLSCTPDPLSQGLIRDGT
jgi:hypothetical protein